MNVLNGVQNFLQLVNDSWTVVIVILGLTIVIINKVKDYLNKSNEDKIEIVKKQIEQVMLKLVTEAEKDYKEWTKAGSIKRSQVLEKIFKEYPILYKVVNQDELIKWIDIVIDKSLETMRSVISDNVKI